MASASSDPLGRRYSSLDRAFADQKIPVGNQTFIRAFCSRMGVSTFDKRSGYIKANRSGEGPALQIYYGWTNGFHSEDEAREAVGPGARVWPSERGAHLWGVDHPVTRATSAAHSKPPVFVDYGTCPRCHLKLPAGGACDTCD
jgi:hypothetical protein